MENIEDRSKKINTPPIEENQAQPNVNENNKSEDNKENEEDEEDEDDENSKEGENNVGTKEDLQGKLKKNEDISGKSLTGIKK